MFEKLRIWTTSSQGPLMIEGFEDKVQRAGSELDQAIIFHKRPAPHVGEDVLRAYGKP